MRRGGLTTGGREGWGSKAAEDMYRIATSLAGFDRVELWKEMMRRQGKRDALVNERTVINSMQVLGERWDAQHPNGAKP